ncbi:MAG: response regulator [Anaerolineaceae bacterium]|nr:MAG: response regulator [Anaerolineaceae bacterium]
MVLIPRIVTVDPAGIVARIVRSSLELLDLSVIQTDIPASEDALNEIDQRVNLVVVALSLDAHMKGFEFALRVKQASPDTAVLILADTHEPNELDEETTEESPFVYLSRPLDIHRFLRVLVAGLEGQESMKKAATATGGELTGGDDSMGAVPRLDIVAARKILEQTQSELGAMVVALADRQGEVLVEVGASGLVDLGDLARSMMPMMRTNIGLRDIVGGQVTTVQFYDGEDYDVFVLSVGLHHFISVLFEGQQGARQFGFVNRFGRKAVEDLIGLIGADAFFIVPAAPKEELPKRQTMVTKAVESEPVELARAEIEFDEEPPELEPVIEPLEPIDDLNIDVLFDDTAPLEGDIFDNLEQLEEMAKQSDGAFQKGRITWDDAKDLGVLKD